MAASIPSTTCNRAPYRLHLPTARASENPSARGQRLVERHRPTPTRSGWTSIHMRTEFLFSLAHLGGGQVFTSDHDYISYPCISLVGKSLFRPAWEIRLTGSALESVPALGPTCHKPPKGSHVHNEFKKKNSTTCTASGVLDSGRRRIMMDIEEGSYRQRM